MVSQHKAGSNGLKDAANLAHCAVTFGPTPPRFGGDIIT